MKIILTHIRQSWLGGTEGYLNQLASYLADHGHRVTIVCRRHEAPPHPAVNLVKLNPFTLGSGHRTWKFAADAARYLRRESCDVVFGLGRTWYQDIIRLGGGCHQTYYDTVHNVLNTKIQRVINLKFLRHYVYKRLEKKSLTFNENQVIICNSRAVKRDIIQRYQVPESRIEVIYNGVDLNRFHPDHKSSIGRVLRNEAGFGDNNFVLLFLGNGYLRKGLDLTLEAMPSIIKRQPETRLMVVGNDSTRPKYETMARDLNIERHVAFLGKRKDVEACYAAADLYILPTRYDPFANSTIEAMACGTPVITTPQNGASELIRSKDHGSIVNPDHKSISDAVSEWLKTMDTGYAGKSARQLAEQHSMESKMNETLRLIESVARRKRDVC